jgi:hypothetical protein
MALPKKNINNYTPETFGPDRRNELKENITSLDTYLPKAVLHEDLDLGFKNFVINELKTVINGNVIPVIMMGAQNWNQFTTTWQYDDKYKNLEFPFISIVRDPNTQFGTNPGYYNIPTGKMFTYAQVPTWDGVQHGVDVYKIPQPIPIDINYSVRLFAYRQRDLNTFNKNVIKKFQSLQAYTTVNGHYIPIIHEDTEDESELTDINKRRYYIQNYNFVLQGILLDSEDFIKMPGIKRIFTIVENKK